MRRWRNPNLRPYAAARADFAAGRDTPRDYLERCIATIEAREPAVRAFVTLNLEAARAAADAATARFRAGAPLSPVDGMPIGVKDIIATRDLPTQMNSPAFAGWQAPCDAACVHALRRGGAVPVGKTVTTEFAIGYSGPTTNAFDAQRTPGGSSSGSAAAVGAGMVPAALGTQTQGSTLRPASYNGALGFKPTLGALPTGGIHPLSATLDHLGIIAGTLDDLWALASQCSLSIGSPGRPFLSGAGPTPAAARPRRLIWLHTRGWSETDEPTRAAFERFVAALEAAGIEVASRDHDARIAALETRLDAWVDQVLDLLAYEMRWPYEGYVERHGNVIGERIHGLLRRAAEMAPADYEALLEQRRAMQDEVRAAAEGADGFVTLSASGIAPPGLAHTGSRTFLAYWSNLGFPSFSLPLLEVEALPLGVQLMGIGGRDGALAATAHWLMRAWD
jgi:Asp-tRNA(Asn)/Glu-tRNA(Gln) amidotransferase A subunit family amidase